MSKSPLAQACYDLALARVRALLAKGHPPDGSKEERFRGQAHGCIDGAPYYTPLGEAARSTVGPVADQLAVIKALLAAGAPVDERDYCSDTPLLLAAGSGRPEVVAALHAAGADLAAVGGHGNAVARLLRLNTPDEPGDPKVQALRLLLRLGVDPKGGFTGEHGLLDFVEDPCEDLAGRSREDKLRARALLELMEVLGEAAPGWAELQAWLERARAANLRGDAAARKLVERLEKLRDQVGGTSFEKAFRKQVGGTALGRYDELRALTRVVLCAPSVVAHESWPSLVRQVLELTVSYGDLTEEAYGERLDVADIEDDEGGVLDLIDDQRLRTVEHCLRACACPAALERPDLAALVEEIARTKRARLGQLSFGDEEARALIEALDRVGHADRLPIQMRLREAFPFPG